MRKKALKRLPKDLKEARDRFEYWRKTRPKLGPIPEELWQDAVSLTKKYGLAPVASSLHLNHTTLRDRAQRVTAALPTRVVRENASTCEAQFVQMPPIPLLQATEHQESLIELRAADGATLTLRIPSEQPIELVGLARLFFRRGA